MDGQESAARLFKEQVDGWKAQYGASSLIGIEEPVRMVFRKPPRHVWADFVESMTKNKGQTDMAYRRLCIACCLFPATEEDAVTIFNEYPGLSITIGDALGELAGNRGSIEIKKY